MGKAPCCDKASVKKGPWSPEEDRQLKEYIDKHGTGGNWIALPNKAGLKRCGKSCRLRWLNYLRPNIKHGDFSDDEDRIICTLYASIGSRWSIIASQLPGRTDNDIKNYWNTKLKKKLLGFPPPQKNKQQQHDLYSSVASQCLQVEGGSTISPYLVDNSCSLAPRVQILPAAAPDQRNCSFIKFGGDQQSNISHINSADLDLLYRADQMMNCAYGREGFNFEAFPPLSASRKNEYYCSSLSFEDPAATVTREVSSRAPVGRFTYFY